MVIETAGRRIIRDVCANRACGVRAPGSNGSSFWPVRTIQGEAARVCTTCAELYDRHQFCQHCDEIYSPMCPPGPPSLWIRCCLCQRSVHRHCELKSGTSIALLEQTPGAFKCRDCRERPSYALSAKIACKAGGRPAKSIATAQNRNYALAKVPVIAVSWATSRESPTPLWDANRDSLPCQVCNSGVPMSSIELGNEGAVIVCQTCIQEERNRRFFDASVLMLKAALDSELNLGPAEDYMDRCEQHTSYLDSVMMARSPMRSPGVDSSNSSSSASPNSMSCSPAPSKEKRRRSKAARTERAASIAASHASLPNMRSTVINRDEGYEGEGCTIKWDWAQCDNPRCLKWRRLPAGVPLDDLKGKWTCKLNRWDRTRSSCDVPEEPFCFGEALPELKPGDAVYDKQKTEFYIQLKAFLDKINTPMMRNPTLGGKDLDLFHLYKEVTQRGGFDTVVSIEGTWARVFRTLPNYSPTVTDASYRLKRYYQEFLQSFEQRMFFKKDIKEIQVQKFASRRTKKTRMKSDDSMTTSATPLPAFSTHAPLAGKVLQSSISGSGCVKCHVRSNQLFTCENSNGGIRVCSTSTAIAPTGSFLLCRACLTPKLQFPVFSNTGGGSIVNKQFSPISPAVAYSGTSHHLAPATSLPKSSITDRKPDENMPPIVSNSMFFRSLPIHIPPSLP